MKNGISLSARHSIAYVLLGTLALPSMASSVALTLQPDNGDCVVSVNVEVMHVTANGDMKSVYSAMNSSGNCTKVVLETFPSAVEEVRQANPSHLIWRQESGSGLAAPPSVAAGFEQGGALEFEDEMADVLLQSLESQLLAVALANANVDGERSDSRNSQQQELTYFMDLSSDAEEGIQSLIRQIDGIATSAELTGNNALSERLRARVDLLLSERASREKRLREAVLERDAAHQRASGIESQLITVGALAAVVSVALLMGWLWKLRVERQISAVDRKRSESWRELHRMDLQAHLVLTRWIPYATFSSLLVSSALALVIGVYANRPIIVGSLNASLGCYIGLFAAAIAVVKWRNDIAKQLMKIEEHV